ncbi:helix-turn-helix domain-containing protein [Streptococcus oriscaviae]|uniref:Transcriptional regulator n=1 Tax=Streptococcus oriscaviae TaxID=2781599 RepID=A0ABX7YIZ3_9STRE|nr:XRE family transcriptional regulator [Streptococcus oriscaviae]QUE53586.1 transcriptional regulator [Streptococcus oriscaviae]
MDNKEFGLKIRDLREKLCFTQEQFCEDETKLSIRQLTRIEAGTSKPTFSTINYIAGRLGMTLYELMPDYIELPDRYKILKYDILRTPTYGEEEMLDRRDSQLTEIYDDYYALLSEEERVAVDTIQSTIDAFESETDLYGRDILDKYLQKILTKEHYSVNDLLIIRLFIEHIRYKETDSDSFQIFLTLVKQLPEHVTKIASNDLFVLRDVLLVIVSVLGSKRLYTYLPGLFSSLDDILKISQDFQKKAILSMLKWKYELFVNKDKEKAIALYEEAIIFANLLENDFLVEKLKESWKLDNE